MADTLVVLGCGYTGIRLVREAVERGMQVVGTSRDDETLEDLRDAGATPVKWDVLEDDIRGIEQHLGPETALVYSIPTIYRKYDDESDGVPRHVVPVEKVLKGAAEHGLERFIYLSSTSVYGDHNGAWVDETTSTDPASPYGRMRDDIEQYLLGASVDFPVNIARLVGIYGPGRTILDYMKSGRYKLVDGGIKPTNRIHVDDIVRSILAMVDRGSSRSRVYNVCDGHPLRVVDLVDFLVEHLDVDRPEVVSIEDYAQRRGPNVAARWKNMYRCKNERLTDELGVELEYPNALDGYRAIFGIEQSTQ
ncbi:MAG: SDR family oxidoreductase [Myxococcota bacterium]